MPITENIQPRNPENLPLVEFSVSLHPRLVAFAQLRADIGDMSINEVFRRAVTDYKWVTDMHDGQVEENNTPPIIGEIDKKLGQSLYQGPTTQVTLSLRQDVVDLAKFRAVVEGRTEDEIWNRALATHEVITNMIEKRRKNR